MLASRARVVPLIVSASTLSLAGTTCSTPASLRTLTSGLSERDSVPWAPLTLTWSAAIDTSTPWGTATGIFPTRDMARIPSRSGDVAEHFATDAAGARLAVGHHASRRRDDGHAQAVHDLRNVVAALVDAQARTAHALDALDHRPAGVVL